MFKQVIVIAGVPRSGTSWLGQIIDSSPAVAYRFQPIFSYAFKDAVNIESTRADYEKFFKGIYESSDDFLLQKDKKEMGLYPVFKKNEELKVLAFKETRYHYLLSRMLHYFNELKLIGIIRHPCGVINSWLKNPREFPHDADPTHEWRFSSCRNKGKMEEFFGYYKWKEVANMYLDLKEKYHDQVYVIKYDDLVDEPILSTRHLFTFVGLDFTKQTEAFLTNCHLEHKESPYAVFKDKLVKEHWRLELTANIADEIMNDITGTRLAQFL